MFIWIPHFSCVLCPATSAVLYEAKDDPFFTHPSSQKHMQIKLCTADQKSWLRSIFASVHMVLHVMLCHCSSACAGHFRAAKVIHLRTLAVFCVFVHFCPQPVQVIILWATLDGGRAAYIKTRRHRHLRELESETCEVVLSTFED